MRKYPIELIIFSLALAIVILGIVSVDSKRSENEIGLNECLYINEQLHLDIAAYQDSLEQARSDLARWIDGALNDR